MRLAVKIPLGLSHSCGAIDVHEHASLLRVSELAPCAQAYGRTTYLITTLQRVPRGTEGAVSAEGTLAGLAAAAFTAGIAIPLGQVGTGEVESRSMAARRCGRWHVWGGGGEHGQCCA